MLGIGLIVSNALNFSPTLFVFGIILVIIGWIMVYKNKKVVMKIFDNVEVP